MPRRPSYGYGAPPSPRYTPRGAPARAVATRAVNRSAVRAANATGKGSLASAAMILSKALTQMAISNNKPKRYKQVRTKPANYVAPKPINVQKPLPKRKRYVTNGKSEGFVQPAQAELKTELEMFGKKGSIHNVENGGILTATSVGAIYPFHGIAEQQVISSMWRAVVKELARQRKTDIVNWTEKVGYMTSNSDAYIAITYVNNPGATPVPANSGVSLTINQNWTWFQLADELMKAWQNTSGSGSQAKEPFLIQYYQEVGNRTGTAPIPLPMATIHCKQVLFEFKCSSTLTVQNRTLAENQYSDNDRDEADDIENNPLVGKLYSGLGKWCNAIELDNRGQESGNLGTKSTVLNKDTGLALFQVGSEYVDTMKIPPPAYVLGFQSAKKVTISPGGILSNKVVFRTTISMSKFFSIFQVPLSLGLPRTESQKVAFGHISGFGLEKMLDSSRAAGPDISVGYQIKQQYCCAIGYAKKSKSNPSLEVSNTAISYSTDKPS